MKTHKQQVLDVLALPQAALVPKQIKELLVSMVDGLEQHQNRLDHHSTTLSKLLAVNERLDDQVQQLKAKG